MELSIKNMLGFYQSPFVESVFMWRFLEIGINTSHLCLQILVVEVGQLLVVEAEVVSQADQQDHGLGILLGAFSCARMS